MNETETRLKQTQSEMDEIKKKATKEIEQILFDAGWQRTSLVFTFPQRPSNDEYELRSVKLADIPVWKSPRGGFFMSYNDFNDGIETQRAFDQLKEPSSTLGKVLAEKRSSDE